MTDKDFPERRRLLKDFRPNRSRYTIQVDPHQSEFDRLTGTASHKGDHPTVTGTREVFPKNVEIDRAAMMPLKYERHMFLVVQKFPLW